MSDLIHGRKGKVTLTDGTTDVLILHIREWTSGGITRDLTEITEFGQDEKEFLVGLLNYGTFTINGYLDPGDVTGQAVLLSALYDATKITGIKFWKDETNFLTPDLVTNPDSGVLVTGYTPAASSADVPSVSFTFQATGAMRWDS